jgi:hypothetical protein
MAKGGNEAVGNDAQRDGRLPKRSVKGAYDDQASLRGRKFVTERY